MLLIVSHHLTALSIDVCGYKTPFSFEDDGICGVLINSMAIIGVNLFVMITGWFGVKSIWPQIFRLVFDCWLYALIALLISWSVFGRGMELGDIKHVIDSRPYWFIWHYIILVLISPLLEAGLKGACKEKLTYWVCLLVIANIGLGFFCRIYNINGYNVFNFIFLYVMARWLKIMQDNKYFKLFSRYGLLTWILSSVILMIGYVVIVGIIPYDTSHAVAYFAYNNPLVILSTLAVFTWFAQFSIKSNVINYCARGALGVYLLHSTNKPLMPYRTQFVQDAYASFDYLGLIGAIFSVFSLCLAVSLIIEWFKSHITIMKRTYAIGYLIENRLRDHIIPHPKL